MIFVTVGSQKFQFNRMLKEIDKLIEVGVITEKVFAQTGYSDYEPRNYEFKKFLNREEFGSVMSECDKVITHGGTGAIIGAVKKGKKVIAIPRLAKFEEHVDDHQLQITTQFKEMKLIDSIYNIENLEQSIKNIYSKDFKEYSSNTKVILHSIEGFIETLNRN